MYLLEFSNVKHGEESGVLMERKVNVDQLRTIACLLVVVYHAYAACKYPTLEIKPIIDIISYGGEIGVTAFFILSGYGIFCSLRSMDEKKQLSFINFMRKRIRRIVPHYYFNLGVALLLSPSVVYLDHVKNIFAHLLFIHNFNFDWHGAINGVLWTMAVIFQFYIIAIPLYKIVKKNPIMMALVIIPITIIFKYLTINYFWIEDVSMYGSFIYMIPSRQIWTSLDNFVLGMVVASITEVKNKELKLSPLIVYIGLCISVWLIVKIGVKYGIYGPALINCSWHSLLAVVLAIFLFFFVTIKQWTNNIFSKILIKLSYCEYGIYLWHLLIINNILVNTEKIWIIINNGKGWMVVFSLTAICIGFGMACSCLFDNASGKLIVKHRNE